MFFIGILENCKLHKKNYKVNAIFEIFNLFSILGIHALDFHYWFGNIVDLCETTKFTRTMETLYSRQISLAFSISAQQMFLDDCYNFDSFLLIVR